MAAVLAITALSVALPLAWSHRRLIAFGLGWLAGYLFASLRSRP